MPPVSKRVRTYDSAKTRTAVLAQFTAVRTAVDTLTPEQLALPTRLGEWTVRDLSAHLSMVLGMLLRHLDRPAPREAEIALLDWPFSTADAATAVDEATRGLAAEADPGELFARVAERIGPELAKTPGDRPVPTRSGPLRLDDFMVTRCVELIVHTDDLNDATGLDIPYDRQALAACTRMLADALAVKAPGGAVEVRIPPYAVVQCVEGPRHTRGTPPNVVETDPLTWIRLATGRTGWAEALDAAKVSASGERADLAPLLPILS
ncbi:maleylpyruvate isomerase family mycothiol-dependent enzyme [Streptomyces jumonjinensis]|uniref:Maleylpyruvate isomerase family mycothiol-dependent enzyme n=1 Tax=Streptomyces jumonjinensis TaxID=1945 RepID=A0A646KP15_STRJU|nr:maleylpyruvate isomerase family mycothiol-dependent enzyme [Streptomyces jumonjinensis]MQT02726.1 maleylpyruvate isomerase family mycothiol-dependent enzyme [Streptomyces jumonjinensis]